MNRIRYTLFAGWIGVILVLSLMPVPEIKTPTNTDKVVHFFMYFLTMFFFYQTFQYRYRNPVVTGLLLSVLFGTFVEVLQHFVPFRGFSVGDILANSLGACVAAATVFVYRKYLPDRNRIHQKNLK